MQLSLSGTQDNIIDVSDEVFNKEFNEPLIHQAVTCYLAGGRAGTKAQKNRSQVKATGSKPWRQKGTGRARAGSVASPLWRGGGVTFGPKPRTINLKLNKKERNLALQTLLYNKRNNISVIGELETLITEPKTKAFCEVCNNYNINLDQKILLVVSTKTTPLKLATKNLKNVELISASHLNTLSLLKAKQILLTPLAVNNIKEIYCD